ncbi:MAG: 30S ribosome-binding factor RbfA [Acidobacteria bacterium]|nr:30S ribosome-binding factor RbfA [Acidobacteriota bacterium]MBU1337445.1 30S ribosome-binding factor RbfA [Acidobacteriota bacterium]MBU1473347.1 30S ribosome-binding factor RbfA [Acidobacteriota bacterium]
MNESIRQKKVASLVQETLSRLILEEFPADENGLISITRIDLGKDLKTARVFLSFYGGPPSDDIVHRLNKRSGFLRKANASRIKLKYNPQLIFSEDPLAHQEEKLDIILSKIQKNE